ncbi:LysR substrate-binding domain-containing protein [Paraburkholderia terrae]|uniref:LysR substrate-binding domain-containing protein n=1 Tax=Paraburkholderia terrae TaxID=311230 RepID=UPI000B02AA55|nr:LysR substrate-binding domain-containing protein [Paraburkholderia terrae]
MNQLMPRLARGELDIVVGRSGQQYDDPQLRIETLYTEPVSSVPRPHDPLAVDWRDVLAYSRIIRPQGTPVRNATETARAAAERTRPAHCVA